MGKLFDITDKVLSYVDEVINDMPGNNGQKVLLQNLIKDGYSTIDYVKDGDARSATNSHLFAFDSNHPEAIQIILDNAYAAAEEISKRAETILPVNSPDEWIIAGYDG